MNAKIEGWPKVAGYCPACGLDTLFLGSGGWVTCSWVECLNPTAVADMIDHRPTAGERTAAIRLRRCPNCGHDRCTTVDCPCNCLSFAAEVSS